MFFFLLGENLIIFCVQPTNINEYYTGSCGCAPAKVSDFEYNIDSPSPPAEESTDVKYKFDFNVEQPKPAANSEVEL